MKREYEEPLAEIELFTIASPITTSWLGWEEEGGWSLRDSEENPWGYIKKLQSFFALRL